MTLRPASAALLLGMAFAGSALAMTIPPLPEVDAATAAAHPELAEKRAALVAERDVLRTKSKKQNAACSEVEEGTPAERDCAAWLERLTHEVELHVKATNNLVAAISAAARVVAATNLEKEGYRGSPRTYQQSGDGLVGGTSWIYGYNVPLGPVGEALRAEADKKLREQMRLAGVSPESFIDPKHYNFIVAVGASHNALSDFMRRVIRDEWKDGRFSASDRELYASLRNREFSRLDCHSNGAMVCLAALELGDAKTAHVRLFGPQITPSSLGNWQRLIESGKVRSVEVFINRGDPIPVASYVGTLQFTQSETVQKLIVPAEILREEIRRDAPGLSVRINECPSRTRLFDLENCHSMKLYQTNLDASRRGESRP